MKYNLQSKPTRYRGRLYRSRLEARWAAFFDLLEWDYEYEPFDLKGWTPDFLIKGYDAILVEVKPSLLHFEFSKYINAIRKENSEEEEELEYELLCLESGPLKNCANVFESISLGHLTDKFSNNSFAAVGKFYNCDTLSFSNKIGFCHEYASWHDRITGNYDKGYFENCDEEIMEKWIQAGNEVMFLKPNSNE